MTSTELGKSPPVEKAVLKVSLSGQRLTGPKQLKSAKILFSSISCVRDPEIQKVPRITATIDF